MGYQTAVYQTPIPHARWMRQPSARQMHPMYAPTVPTQTQLHHLKTYPSFLGKAIRGLRGTLMLAPKMLLISQRKKTSTKIGIAQLTRISTTMASTRSLYAAVARSISSFPASVKPSTAPPTKSLVESHQPTKNPPTLESTPPDSATSSATCSRSSAEVEASCAKDVSCSTPDCSDPPTPNNPSCCARTDA